MRRLTIATIGCALAALLCGCAHKQKTPFDHLYGEAWCQGVYQGYADQYEGVYRGAGESARGSYGYLVQEGVSALSRLQSRGTPFYVGIDQATSMFSIKREVPERLTFSADMTEADRQRATEEFERARAHLAEDYTDVQRLEHTLNGLLDTLTGVRSVIQRTEEETYNLSWIRQSLKEEGIPPFELPYQVTLKRYDEVLVLLLARLDQDLNDLKTLESGIMTVVLAARATDSRSQSLAGNIEVAVLASVMDMENARTRRLPSTMPTGEVWTQQAHLGEAMFARVIADPGYQQYAAAKGSAGPDPIGAVLSIIDSIYGTHLAEAAVAVRNIIEGKDVDYLALLKGVASLAPRGTMVGDVLNKAVELTDKYRDVMSKVDQAMAVAGKIQNAGDALSQVGGASPQWLINQAGSAQGALGQVVFIQSEAERLDVQAQLKGFGLL
jgi:hypothetical protein